MVICQTMSGQPYAVAPDRLIFRPSVYAIIPRATAIVLITLRSTGKYGLPGGAVEPHEPLEQALHREVREETGLTVVIERLLHFKETFFYYEPADRAYHTLSFFYLCQPQTRTLIPDDQVHDGAFPEASCPRWIDPSNISPHDIQGFFRDELVALLPTLRA